MSPWWPAWPVRRAESTSWLKVRDHRQLSGCILWKTDNRFWNSGFYRAVSERYWCKCWYGSPWPYPWSRARRTIPYRRAHPGYCRSELLAPHVSVRGAIADPVGQFEKNIEKRMGTASESVPKPDISTEICRDLKALLLKERHWRSLYWYGSRLVSIYKTGRELGWIWRNQNVTF